MEIKVWLDKENDVFLSKTFDLSDMQIDENGNLVLKANDVEIKFTPLDAIKLSQFSMQLLSQFGANLIITFNNNIVSDKNESNTTTKQ